MLPVDLLPWLVAAALTAVGGGLAFVSGRRSHIAALVAAGLGLAGALTGLVWRMVITSAWPGALPADALVLLAAGGLVVLIARQRTPAERNLATGLTLLIAAALLVAAAWLAWQMPAPPTPIWAAGAPLFGLRSLLAALGLGGWLVVLAASLTWAIRGLRQREAHGRPADDPGRPAALTSFLWLTAALVAAALWQLVLRGAATHPAPAALWQAVTWLLGAGYLHVTSNWRPVRLPAWIATLLAGLALAAAVMAALRADSWLL